MGDRLVILVHGLGTRHTDRSILDELTPLLVSQGFVVMHFRYGFMSVLGAVLKNKKIARDLHSIIQSVVDYYEQILVVGHSNGCALMDMASHNLQNNNKKIGYIYISPAASVHKAPDNAVSWLDVWYNPRDYVIRLIRLAMKLSLVIRRSQWGLMGIVGYRGSDQRVTNFELNIPHLSWRDQHVAFFKNLHEHLDFFRERIEGRFAGTRS